MIGSPSWVVISDAPTSEQQWVGSTRKFFNSKDKATEWVEEAKSNMLYPILRPYCAKTDQQFLAQRHTTKFTRKAII